MGTKIAIGAGILVVAGAALAVTFSPEESDAPDDPVSSAATTTPTSTPSTPTKDPAYYRANGKGTAATVAASIAEAKSFAALLSTTGLDATLKGKGPFTVFVPNNAAFRATGPGILDNMSFAEKKRLVQNHIISGKRIDIQALTSGGEVSLSGDALNFTIAERDRVPRVNGALIYGSYTASNGVVYLVTQVLIPPEKPVIR